MKVKFKNLDDVKTRGLGTFELYYPFISNNPYMNKIGEKILTISNRNENVLIQGETGTGKDCIARSIYKLSSRTHEKKPFITLDCGSIPINLAESTLFGHTVGAFTGATKATRGKFEMANEGILFLDEISNMHPSIMPLLLRALDGYSFCKIGSTTEIKSNFTTISASNKDIVKMVLNKDFRDDLFFRLATVIINIPPLRNRPEDIPLIIGAILKKYNYKYNSMYRFSNRAMKSMCDYHWPGNIRELIYTIRRTLLFADTEYIDCPELYNIPELLHSVRDTGDILNLNEMIKLTILKALKLRGWVQKDAATVLGITSRQMQTWIEKLNITHASWRKYKK